MGSRLDFQHSHRDKWIPLWFDLKNLAPFRITKWAKLLSAVYNKENDTYHSAEDITVRAVDYGGITVSYPILLLLFFFLTQHFFIF